MKRRLLIALCVSLLFLFGAPAFAHAQTTQMFGKGSVAFATFQSTDSTGCFVTQVFIGDSLETQHTPPGSPQYTPVLTVEVDQFNLCNPTALLSGQGITGTFTSSIANNLSSASLSTTIGLFDFISGNNLNVTVNLNWTGTGDVQHGTSATHYNANGTTIISVAHGAFRSGQASGTVSDGMTNYTPLPDNSATLENIRDGTITITH